MFHDLLERISEQESIWAWAVGISLVTFLVSLLAVPIVVIRMEADYFQRSASEALPRTPLRLVRRAAKNVIGWILILMGILMLVLPGQGLLTIALGVSLIDFPGKRRLQLRIARMKGVYTPINWIREKAGKPPLDLH